MLKKIKRIAKKSENYYPNKKIRIMFQDEACFGRINKPKYCWCRKGIRPQVPCHHIREYRYTYGAVEPKTGENFFLVMPNCNTYNMNVFMQELSKEYEQDMILLICDGASWHKSKGLKIPKNIKIIHIPPYTPEINPI
ncbi:IS630 family transposase [Criibacterium bergeronii]